MSDPIRTIGGRCHGYLVHGRPARPVVEMNRGDGRYLYRLTVFTAMGEKGPVEFRIYVPNDWTDGQVMENLITSAFQGRPTP